MRTEHQLFVPDPCGGVLANKVLNRRCCDLATESGVRHITSHRARHTAGSSYAVMGAGQKVIGALLGHSDSASTERHTHVAQSATAALVQARWLRLGGSLVSGHGREQVSRTQRSELMFRRQPAVAVGQ